MLSITISNANPHCALAYDMEYQCEVCNEHYSLTTDGKVECVTCIIRRSKKGGFRLLGWIITRTDNQVIAHPIPPGQ